MATDIEFGINNLIRLKAHEFGTRTLWVDSNKFMKELRSTFITDIGLLPPGLRWVSPAKTFWLFESVPRLQQVVFHYGEADEGHEGKELFSCAVHLPWTAMLVEINSEYFPIRTWIYALGGPIRDGRESIGVLPLPNHYPSAQVCYPKDASLKASTCHNVGDAIKLAKEFAWFSYANEDIADTFNKTVELKMPAYLFVDDNNNWRGDFEDIRELLEAWSNTAAMRILTCTTPYISPSNSILYPEQLLGGGDPIESLADAMITASKVEQFNFTHEAYFEEAVRAAHSRSF